MNPFAIVLDATDSALVLATCSVVDIVVVLVLLALVGHILMIPVRRTTLGQVAGQRAEVLGDRARELWAEHRAPKAGAQ